MASATYAKTGLAIGVIAGVGALAGAVGAGIVLWRQWLKSRDDDHAPAAAFAGSGAHKDSFVHTRDAGPDHIRDEDGDDWDALDQASDESFPSSDPPVANDFRTPAPIDYSKDKTAA